MISLQFTFQNYSALSLLQDSDQRTKSSNSIMVRTDNKGGLCFYGSCSNTVEQTPTKYQSSCISGTI